MKLFFIINLVIFLISLISELLFKYSLTGISPIYKKDKIYLLNKYIRSIYIVLNAIFYTYIVIIIIFIVVSILVFIAYFLSKIL